jgi:hypothetical protein
MHLPTKTQVENFIEIEFQRLEAERLENDILLSPENQAIIAEKKAGIQDVITRLS